MKKFRPWVSFSDFVVRDFQARKSKAVDEPEGRDYRRGWLVWLVVLMAMGLLLVRLLVLQLLEGGKYRVLADENRVKKIRIPAPRGKILDRNGEELLRDEAFAQVVGYVGEVSEEEVGLLKEKGAKYTLGSLIGRTGVEAQYEEMLRGEDGGRLVEVDNMGEVVRGMGKREPVAGSHLRLAIGRELQIAAYQAVEGKKAGVVVSNPKNGEVLALVSSPSFDPVRIAVYLNDKNLPLFNRAMGGAYPPGSTFKMVTTAAALESGRVKRDF